MNASTLSSTAATAGVLTICLALTASPAFSIDKISFGTDWLAEADHGGFYQALADGTYAKYGLDVEIKQGGPGAQNRALLLAGKLDFYLGTQQEQLTGVEEGIPLVDVAAFYQKNAQVILTHPDADIETFGDIARLETIYMTHGGFGAYFEWMKANFTGFRDEQFKPYNFSSAPFLADTRSAQQGLITAEPYEIERQTGKEPKIFLLADSGYAPYATMITVQQNLIDRDPDLVQRFVDASIEGWYNYLYGDNAAANVLIKKDNPEMTDGQIVYAIDKMKQYGIVDSGEALTKGIGCLSAERYKQLFDALVKVNLLQPDTDYTKAFDPRFSCKGVGMSLKERS
ncbi:ABC transporter substrate-binding protein (plasmid) [Ensifer adhaerens]|uniref:ABC transporter substrate-binding protein n=1 Tax=Ensifer adhaerens TaxID=106592 RepID=UPI001CBEA271|nr:ABC transporter substrate-binding protein [Ensifer adhaerens]MBZ7927532.1 ABC transporter substrate-binding protein [Ensifer adhaerens]UAX97949.1 ABC transporter substrate-binding protein [Ensifer adhaerens]UAY05328.1 ABC transporter substrate-binding protein [Ensifer adhaerens]UAY12706.1 ABC transporter substrate-binding protein [Ensifer adhaerens]